MWLLIHAGGLQSASKCRKCIYIWCYHQLIIASVVSTSRRVYLALYLKHTMYSSLVKAKKSDSWAIGAIVNISRQYYINTRDEYTSESSTLNNVFWKNTDTHVFFTVLGAINLSPLGENGRHFADDIFKCLFLNENVRILLEISLKFVPMVRINNIPALVQIMAWQRPGDKPLSGTMMVSLLTYICVTRP